MDSSCLPLSLPPAFTPTYVVINTYLVIELKLYVAIKDSVWWDHLGRKCSLDGEEKVAQHSAMTSNK